MYKYILGAVLLLLSILIYIILSFFVERHFSFIYLTINGTLIMVYIFSLFFNIEGLKKKNRQLEENLIDIYRISSDLLNVFYIYFDDSFIIINTIAQDERRIYQKLEEFYESYRNFKEYSQKMKNQNFNKEKNITNISAITASLIHEIRSFLDLILSVENSLFNDFKSKIIDFIKKEEFKQMVIEYEYYSEIIFEFINSIINKINDTSKPLSEQIFIIKKNINEFIKDITSWNQDLTNDASKKNFNNIIKKYNMQNYEFKNLSDIITTSYKNLEINLISIVSMIEKIYENSFQIQDIAERIKILSVNASIESSRSGKDIHGFRVISSEIKKLSESTQSFITDILILIGNAKDIAKHAIDAFNDEAHNLTIKLNFQKEGFEEFYSTLNNYNKDFNLIFSSISRLTGEISEHINKFSPIFQMHDISVQELENVNIINRKFLDDNKNEIVKIIDTINEDRKSLILNNIINSIESKITTDSEISILNKVSDRYNLKRRIKLKKYNEIDFF